ncbi:hypothetical protein FXF51_56955 [Nonomuraea sp. PA05]|uniref:hypothetical protein n=1 Tax=Nonomuraea sp. PA05 TaxID=2604466 RepID=UPI0011D89022|nr:hypothetical protein [Nonomuraea sp. PA05]TYB50271.1 hypothetical protein FXF51_56955 [Nonomuraea sp. PA05]
MTDQERERRVEPPGLPLWRAAERKRAEEGVQKFEWIAQIGIGRKSYDRLTTQENPPITRTVRKIADRIGMAYTDALRLIGQTLDDSPPADSGADLIVQGPKGRILLQVKDYRREEAERQIQVLRKAAGEAGKTLGDALVIVGLAEPEELRLTENGDAGKTR